ncbi:uncharacterized protein [Procambarus clarkii]|uniref:uncharacterized protein n=1 Tax=Procambarus clarkii TaxID=6728 RepID=UPI00374301AA
MGTEARRPKGQYTTKRNYFLVSSIEKVLGVNIIPNLNREVDVNRITTAAYSTLAKIRTSLRKLKNEVFRSLYIIYVRPAFIMLPHRGAPNLKKHTRKLENVQKFATRLLPELRGMRYEERLEEQKPTPIEKRKERGGI